MNEQRVMGHSGGRAEARMLMEMRIVETGFMVFQMGTRNLENWTRDHSYNILTNLAYVLPVFKF